MHNRLKAILQDKQQAVAELKQSNTVKSQVRQSSKSFQQALSQPGLNVIAEIKRRSPSRGDLAEIINPIDLADTYAKNGASAISVLTDAHFSGKITDLEQVTKHLKNSTSCVLRKDFVIDTIQIDEAIAAGADAVLLIVAVLQEKTQAFIEYCAAHQIDALVEVHTDAELDIALAANATIIGVNNRDLTSFDVDPQRSIEIKKRIPNDKITVAESGIFTAVDAKRYQEAGFNAILVGEALVKADDPGQLITEFRGQHD